MDPRDEGAVLQKIKEQIGEGRYRLTRHAVEERIEEGITLTEILEALQTATLIEDYPEHRRGPCCLLGGTTGAGRPIHVVCTTALELLVIITVYEPKEPKWITPTERRRREG
jgi:hypothetical protein